MGGRGSTNHVTSLLLTSPRAATKRGMPSCLRYCTEPAPLPLSEERERRGREQRVQPPSPLILPTQTHTHHKTLTHRFTKKSTKKKNKTSDGNNTQKQTRNLTKKGGKNKSWSHGPHAAAAAPVVSHIFLLSSPLHTHAHTHSAYSPALRSLSLAHIGELVHLPCSASSAAAARRNE